MGQWVKAMTAHTWEPEFKPQIPQCEEETSSHRWSSDIHTCTGHTWSSDIHTHTGHTHTHPHNIEANVSLCMFPCEWMIMCVQGCVYLCLAFSFITSLPLSQSGACIFSAPRFHLLILCCSKLFVCFVWVGASWNPGWSQIHYATEGGPQFLTSSLYLPRAETAGVLLQEALKTRSHVAPGLTLTLQSSEGWP